jgi:hypothetical protein
MLFTANKSPSFRAASWGFNVVRLGTMWSGLEPSEAMTNRTGFEWLQPWIKFLLKDTGNLTGGG